MKRIGIAGWLTMLLATAAFAQSGDTDAPEARRNWYNDPSSRCRGTWPNAVAARPVDDPGRDDGRRALPRRTRHHLLARASLHEAEFYMYDAPIADAVKAHFAGSDRLHGTSLWITVQRRFIYVEGCADTAFDQPALQRELEALPDVEQVFVRITDDPRKRLPYKARGQPDRTPN